MKKLLKYLMLAAIAVSAFAPGFCGADQDGTINLVGPEAVCVVDGDFDGVYEPGDEIAVSRFNKQFAFGEVVGVKASYMVVKIKSRTNEYFVKPGDIVHEPIVEHEEIETLRATIDPPVIEEQVEEETAPEEKAEEEKKPVKIEPITVQTNPDDGLSIEERLQMLQLQSEGAATSGIGGDTGKKEKEDTVKTGGGEKQKATTSSRRRRKSSE